jgi:S-adenosylmethionine/arginine decarboxylase-like enzyme
MILAHKHFIGRFEVMHPPREGERAFTEKWFERLIEAQGMEILEGPHARYHKMPGNRGWTGTCIITTSHVAMHIWDEVSPALVMLDFYTCGHLDTQKILAAVEEFNVVKSDWWVLDREFTIVRVGSGGDRPWGGMGG